MRGQLLQLSDLQILPDIDDVQRPRGLRCDRELRVLERLQRGELQCVRGRLLQLSDVQVLPGVDDVQRPRDLRRGRELRVLEHLRRDELR